MGRMFVRTGKGESRDNIVSMNLWSEKEFSSETAQFLTAPTSESDTKVRSMIVWQVLVMKFILYIIYLDAFWLLCRFEVYLLWCQS